MENWKAVVGYEGIYEVSDHGRVRRVKRGQGTWPGRILSPTKDRGGYSIVHLCKEGIRHACKVHRLVLTAFIGSPNPGQEGNHKNGIKADNRLTKLEWVTRGKNLLHRCCVLGIGRGESNGSAKLTANDIPVIRRLLAEGKLLQREIGEMFGVSRPTISRIKSGRRWAHV